MTTPISPLSGPARLPAAGAMWEEVELLEQLMLPGNGAEIAAGVAARKLRAFARARRELRPLRRWQRISDKSFRGYRRPANHVRLHRLLDFVRDGDRVLDVGIGFGYVTATLLRERRLDRYWGIDLKPLYRDAALDALRANGLDPARAQLEVLSVLDAEPAWLAERRPDVVLLLEVLEHIEDPVAALQALAAGLDEDATVLLTVPLYGRLDNVWGHASRFDRARIEDVCTQAGLRIHHAEALFSAWALVAAGRGAAPPERVRAAAATASRATPALRRAARARPRPAPAGYAFESVYMGGSGNYARPGNDPERVTLKGRLTGVFCTVQAPASAPASGGVRLAVTAPSVLRLELLLENAEAVEAIEVVGLDAEEGVRLGWRRPRARRRPAPDPATVVLVPGQGEERFVAFGPVEPEAVAAVDVVAHVRAGATATLRVKRAAFTSAPSSAFG